MKKNNKGSIIVLLSVFLTISYMGYVEVMENGAGYRFYIYLLLLLIPIFFGIKLFKDSKKK